MDEDEECNVTHYEVRRRSYDESREDGVHGEGRPGVKVSDDLIIFLLSTLSNRLPSIRPPESDKGVSV